MLVQLIHCGKQTWTCLNKNNELNLDDPNWKIYTEDIPTLPHYVGPTGKVRTLLHQPRCCNSRTCSGFRII